IANPGTESRLWLSLQARLVQYSKSKDHEDFCLVSSLFLHLLHHQTCPCPKGNQLCLYNHPYNPPANQCPKQPFSTHWGSNRSSP
ncbi:hypothetical protein SERLADRAFT_456306, partial [Serpula lacrymans var. lacrymans S7.9]